MKGKFMKMTKFHRVTVLLALTGLVWSASTVLAQNSPGPQLAYGVPQVLQLVQARVGDDTIIAYIKNSGNSYGLSADQIIYLRQQGASDAVVTAMLQQPSPAVVATAPVAMPTTLAPQPVASESVSTATVAPSVTYVQSVPAPTYYYAQPYYYPGYAWCSPVSLSFGWGWGGGWHGGGYGGWHGGGYGGGHGGWHH
jgi:hypothetical protein